MPSGDSFQRIAAYREHSSASLQLATVPATLRVAGDGARCEASTGQRLVGTIASRRLPLLLEPLLVEHTKLMTYD